MLSPEKDEGLTIIELTGHKETKSNFGTTPGVATVSFEAVAIPSNPPSTGLLTTASCFDPKGEFAVHVVGLDYKREISDRCFLPWGSDLRGVTSNLRPSSICIRAKIAIA